MCPPVSSASQTRPEREKDVCCARRSPLPPLSFHHVKCQSVCVCVCRGVYVRARGNACVTLLTEGCVCVCVCAYACIYLYLDGASPTATWETRDRDRMRYPDADEVFGTFGFNAPVLLCVSASLFDFQQIDEMRVFCLCVSKTIENARTRTYALEMCTCTSIF